MTHTTLTDKLNHDQWIRKNSPNVRKAAKFAKMIGVAPYNEVNLGRLCLVNKYKII